MKKVTTNKTTHKPKKIHQKEPLILRLRKALAQNEFPIDKGLEATLNKFGHQIDEKTQKAIVVSGYLKEDIIRIGAKQLDLTKEEFVFLISLTQITDPEDTEPYEVLDYMGQSELHEGAGGILGDLD